MSLIKRLFKLIFSRMVVGPFAGAQVAGPGGQDCLPQQLFFLCLRVFLAVEPGCCHMAAQSEGQPLL